MQWDVRVVFADSDTLGDHPRACRGVPSFALLRLPHRLFTDQGVLRARASSYCENLSPDKDQTRAVRRLSGHDFRRTDGFYRFDDFSDR
jgi:hypothetical protein